MPKQNRVKRRQKAWTNHDELFVRRHANLMTVKLIAHHLGRTVKSVECWAWRNDVELED